MPTLSHTASVNDRTTDEQWMHVALGLAAEAAADGEVPVGAIVVLNGEVIGSGRNQRERTADPTAHAEMLAIREATSRTKDWRLTGATLFVTLEPCVMCAGALWQSRITRVVYGATDPKGGAMGSLYNVAVDPRLNHEIEFQWGVCADECGAILTEYFARLRTSNTQSAGASE